MPTFSGLVRLLPDAAGLVFIAFCWKAVKFLSALGLIAKTMPFSQWFTGLHDTHVLVPYMNTKWEMRRAYLVCWQ